MLVCCVLVFGVFEYWLILGFWMSDQISEYEIIEISENVCNLKKQEADWILKIDIVEEGDRLEVRMLSMAFNM